MPTELAWDIKQEWALLWKVCNLLANNCTFIKHYDLKKHITWGELQLCIYSWWGGGGHCDPCLPNMLQPLSRFLPQHFPALQSLLTVTFADMQLFFLSKLSNSTTSSMALAQWYPFWPTPVNKNLQTAAVGQHVPEMCACSCTDKWSSDLRLVIGEVNSSPCI